MNLYEIAKEIPAWVSGGTMLLILTGMATKVAIDIYRNTKKLNADFQRLQKDYKEDFSKEEIIPFYEDLMINVRPSLMGKKRKIADKIKKGLEEQIMTYTTQEIQEAITSGAKLPFERPIESHSQIYRKAVKFHRP